MIRLWAVIVLGLALSMCVEAAVTYEFDEFSYNVTNLESMSFYETETSATSIVLRRVPINPNATMVNLTLIEGAAAKGAVCLDGTPPAYHFHPGFGFGANSWLVDLEGGGWCGDIASCVYRKTSPHGSSSYMPKQLPFTGILSNKPEENPDFFNWNRVRINYCDGASFTGDSEDKVTGLQFRGQRIWEAAINELMAKGMRNATQALLQGCSAGGIASILHCDEFRSFFSSNVKVKCLADAGMFMDVNDVSGNHTLRNLFQGVVTLHNVSNNLPPTCTNHLDPTSCFFPQNIISDIKTPLFILNAGYDAWQIKQSLATKAADPNGTWIHCKKNYLKCSVTQIEFLQCFRSQMVHALDGFAKPKQNGLYINSCFAHCQSERQDTWFSDNSPLIGNKGIANSVGDWYFDRSDVKLIDCPYPCGRKTCHNMVSRGG